MEMRVALDTSRIADRGDSELAEDLATAEEVRIPLIVLGQFKAVLRAARETDDVCSAPWPGNRGDIRAPFRSAEASRDAHSRQRPVDCGARPRTKPFPHHARSSF